MTKDEAIKELKERIDLGKREYAKDIPEYIEALEMAVKAMKELADCRNELCLRCGYYHEAHLGKCRGCRWEK